jgi:hypothetical protein
MVSALAQSASDGAAGAQAARTMVAIMMTAIITENFLNITILLLKRLNKDVNYSPEGTWIV